MLGEITCYLFGGLGLFMLGARSTSEAMQVVAADRLRRIIASASAGRLIGVASGAAAAAIVQLILEIRQSALLLLGVGAFLQFFSSHEGTRFAGQLAAGIGMLFFGLHLMKTGAAMMHDFPELAGAFAAFGDRDFANLALSIATGAVFTVAVQSSNITLGTTIALATTGLLSFEGAAAFILGQNIGTTVAAQLAASQGTTNARRTAAFHFAVNTIAVLVAAFVFPQWLELIDHLSPGDPRLVDANGYHPSIAGHIAVAYTSLNVILAAVALPLLDPLVRMVSRIAPEGHTEQTNLEFLHPSMAESPTLAIEQGRLEVVHLAGITHDILHLTKTLYRQPMATGSRLRDRILKKERITDAIQHDIIAFMSKVMPAVQTEGQTEEIRNLIRLASEIESVADYCERLANYRRRMLRMNIEMDQRAMGDLNQYLDATIEFYDEVVDRGRREETSWMETVNAKSRVLLETADQLRDDNLARLAAQRFDPDSGIFFNDMLVAMRRIRNHSVNIAQAFQGLK